MISSSVVLARLRVFRSIQSRHQCNSGEGKVARLAPLLLPGPDNKHPDACTVLRFATTSSSTIANMEDQVEFDINESLKLYLSDATTIPYS